MSVEGKYLVCDGATLHWVALSRSSSMSATFRCGGCFSCFCVGPNR